MQPQTEVFEESRQYTEDFYEEQREGSRRSAREVVPLVLKLMQPERVVDVGCGVGTWLSVFKENGVKEILGVDGEYVDKAMLQIPVQQFLSHDLKQPVPSDEQFDLVVSLEVGEHLPDECAEIFVESLTKLGPAVLFSAAIPFQGGTHHINEQWPDYWAKLFRNNGYEVVDCIRKQIWQNARVEWWYAQNMLLFVRRDYLESHAALKEEFEKTNFPQLSIVHPGNYSMKSLRLTELDPGNASLKQTVSSLPTLTKSAVEKRIKKMFAKEDNA